jgi:hypothetical protein
MPAVRLYLFTSRPLAKAVKRMPATIGAKIKFGSHNANYKQKKESIRAPFFYDFALLKGYNTLVNAWCAKHLVLNTVL